MADLAAFFAKKASKKKTKKGVINLQEIGEQLERRAMEQIDEVEDSENNPMDEASERGNRQNLNDGATNEDSEWLDFDDKPNIPIAFKQMADDDEDKRPNAEPTRTWNINSNKVGPAPPTAFIKKKFKGLKPKLDIMDEEMFPSIDKASEVEQKLKKEEEETRLQEIREKREREKRVEEKRRRENRIWEKRERAKKEEEKRRQEIKEKREREKREEEERIRRENVYKRPRRSATDGMTGNCREEGPKRGGEGEMHNPTDIYDDMFFGLGGGFSRGEKPTKVRDTVHQMTVSLDKMYNGCTKRLRLQRHILCPKCDGIGGEVKQCETCNGRGVELRNMQIGPGMIQRVQQTCSQCSGEGEQNRDPCKHCGGMKRIKSEEILEVHIAKGMRDGQKFVFHGKGEQQHGLEPANVIIVVDQEQHSVFTRRGSNLFMDMKLALVEVLCGCTKHIETLDKRVLAFSLLPGEVSKHKVSYVIHGEGMPTRLHPDQRGDLIIKFAVEFPNWYLLSTKNIEQLRNLLPDDEGADEKEPVVLDGDNVEVKHIQLVPFPKSVLRQQKQKAETGGPQAARCATQ